MINTRSCMYTWAHWRSCRTGLLCGGSCTDLLFRTISMHAHHLVCLAASTGAMIPLLIPFELVLHLIGEAVWNISWCALDMGQQWGTGEYSEQGQPFQVEVTNQKRGDKKLSYRSVAVATLRASRCSLWICIAVSLGVAAGAVLRRPRQHRSWWEGYLVLTAAPGTSASPLRHQWSGCHLAGFMLTVIVHAMLHMIFICPLAMWLIRSLSFSKSLDVIAFFSMMLGSTIHTYAPVSVMPVVLCHSFTFILSILIQTVSWCDMRPLFTCGPELWHLQWPT